jgi:hypothetical protein
MDMFKAQNNWVNKNVSKKSINKNYCKTILIRLLKEKDEEMKKLIL